MLALVGVRHLCAVQARHRRVPGCSAADRGGRDPYPGASPENVEREILEPIEEVISGISGVDKITSNGARRLREHHRRVRLREGPAGGDAGDPRRDLRNPQRLPPEMEEPILTRFDPADLPIVSMTLSSPTADRRRADAARRPGYHAQLRALRASRRSTSSAAIEREMTVELRSAGAAGLRHRHRPGRPGAAGAEPRGARRPARRAISTSARSACAAGWTRRKIRAASSSPSRAAGSSASATSRRPRRAPKNRGRRRSSTASRPSASTSSSPRATARRPWQTLCGAKSSRFRQRLPADVTLRIVRDAGVRVENSVSNVQEALIEGAAADRAGRVPVPELVALDGHHRPGAAGLGARLVRRRVAFGFTLNTMSLLGLSLAIGILIDDAIVVRENIVRHVEMGKDHYTAALRRAPTRSAWRLPRPRSRSSSCSCRSRSWAASPSSGSRRSR